MRFLVPRVALIRLLRVVCHAGHPLLRIEALAGVLTLTCGDTEAGCEAAISQPGVCFLRHSKLKKLLQSYHSDAGQSAAIEIGVSPEGIRVGRTTVSRDGWEISLFANPATAPRTLRFRLPREDEPETDTQMLLPFVPDRTASPAPARFSCRSIQP
jgi:hypothetical protein